MPPAVQQAIDAWLAALEASRQSTEQLDKARKALEAAIDEASGFGPAGLKILVGGQNVTQ